VSVAVRAPAAAEEAVYARLFRSGRGQVLSLLGREFPRLDVADLEDIASVAMLEMVHANRLTEYSSGAIGQWHHLSRLRVIDELRRRSARGEPAGSDALAERSIAAQDASVHEIIEHALSEWRVLELMAQMSERAATYVRLQLLEGGRRADVMRTTGWSRKQYEAAQSEAKRALRATLQDLDSAERCSSVRDVIDAAAIGERLSIRKRIELRAHSERCCHCRAYRGEAERTVRSVAPLIGLLAPAGGGAATLATGAIAGTSVAVPASGLLGKSLVAVCIGAVCIGGAIKAMTPQHHPAQTPHPATASALGGGGDLRGAIFPTRVGPAPTRTGATRSTGLGTADFLGLGLEATHARSRKDARTSTGAEAALGFGAQSRPNNESAPASGPRGATASVRSQPDVASSRPKRPAAATCVPGELGC
jgi:hypothetical protein